MDDNSVYRRARTLAPIFPWLLFNALFPASAASPSSHLRGVVIDRVDPAVVVPSRPRRGDDRAIDGARGIRPGHRRRRGGRRAEAEVQNYCGKTWDDAISSCLRPCPTGEAEGACDYGETCFADVTSCPSLTVAEGGGSGGGGGVASSPPPQSPGVGGGGSGHGGVAGGVHDEMGLTGGIAPTPLATAPPFGSAQVSTTQASQTLPAQTGVSTVASNTPPPPGAAPGVTQDDAYCAGTTGVVLVPIEDCLGFVSCQNSRMTAGSLTPCALGLIFDVNMGICNWPSETNVCGQPLPALTGGSTATSNTPGAIQDDDICADAADAELVPIEDCLGFVFCQNSRMSGNPTLCSPGLIFDVQMGICNWPSETNLCGFEFCPNKMSGYVSFEECTKFYYCTAGKIDGDIDVCPDGTLFDVVSGICDWASMVVCDTKAPTPAPVMVPVPVTAQSQPPGVVTPPPTYANVGGASTAVANVSSLGPSPKPTAEGSSTSFQHQAARLRFTPTDDAYVKESQPYANYNDHYVVVDQDARYDGLLRFYVQGLENRKVEYVKLRLYVSNQSTMGGNIYKCSDDWHEDVVTWDSVPSIIGDQPVAVVKAALLDEWIEIDVSGLVQEDGPVSLRITSDSSDNVMYSSKENANGNSPELIVGVEPADPSTATFGNSTDSLPTVKNTFKIGPSDDAFVFRTTGNKNYGEDIDLKVDMDDGYKNSYLRFDLSKVQIEAVISAKLRLYATLSSPSGGMFITVTDSEWNEKTVTYNNAPPADGIPLGMLDNVEAGKWYELDITDAITKSGPLTICILGNHKDKVMYSSKDGPHSPEIALTLEEIVPLTTGSGRVIELIPTDDATIALQTPDSNFGTNDDLKTDTLDGMHNFLLRFDATNVPRGQVKSATLRLYSMNVEPAFGGTFIENRITQWDEQTITWKNAPESDGRVMGSLIEVEYGSWYDMDVTSAVIGGSAVSFRVSSPHSIAAIYGSKESDNKPQLIIEYSPPDQLPEGFDVYIPTDDTSILMEKPDENFGRIEELKVDGYSGVYNSLLRFDLSSVKKGTVGEAILRLYAVDGSPSGGTFVSTQNTDWTQHQVTWTTAPAADGEILETLGEVVPYQWYEIDLAKIAKELGGEYLSIRIAPSHGLRCAYSSSRDRLGHLPQLLIKVDLFLGTG